MEKMSKDEERRIMSALQTSVGLVNDGMHPNDAVIKVASEHQFGPAVVQRMVEALNVSKTLSHMKTASGQSRADTFPLADTGAILSAMYPDSVEAPATKQAAAYVPAELLRPETKSFMKIARVTQPLPFATNKVAAYAQDPELIERKRSGQHRGLVAKVASAKSDYRVAFDKVLKLAKEASEYFKVIGSVDFSEVEKRAYAQYGDMGIQIMDIIQLQGCLRVKRASYSARPRVVFDATQSPYRMIAKLAEAAGNMHKKAEAAVDVEFELEAFTKQSQPARASEDSLTDVLTGDGVLNFSKAAIDLGTVAAMGGMSALGLKEPNPEASRRDALNAVIDPEHESAMNSAKVKAMLNDFVSNDPILSSYDPAELTSSYNHIAQLTPNVAMQPMVMRGMLRKMLQQGGVMEPFEAHQISEIEKRLTGLNQTPDIADKSKPQ